MRDLKFAQIIIAMTISRGQQLRAGNCHVFIVYFIFLLVLLNSKFMYLYNNMSLPYRISEFVAQ